MQLNLKYPKNILGRLAVKRNSTHFSNKSVISQTIDRESAIGSRLFGVIPPNRERQFFMLDSKTWIWYEAWRDTSGKHQVTTRYEIRGSAIYKTQNDLPATQLTGVELINFHSAVQQYYFRVAADVYNRPIPA
jgi:hypothetical protein